MRSTRLAPLLAALTTTLPALPLAPARAQGLFEAALAAPEEEPTTTTGDEPAPLTTVSVPAAASRLELEGYARSALFAGELPGEDGSYETKAGYGELSLSARAAMGRHGAGFAQLRTRRGLLGGDEATTEVDLREAYADAFLGPVDVRFGHQIIVWGRADGINPTDNLTPKDLRVRSPETDDQRLANLALRSSLYLGPLRLEGVWVPAFRPAHLPDFTLSDQIVVAEPLYPNSNLINGTGALRLHLQSGALDASLSYLVGYAPFPGFALEDFDPLGLMTGSDRLTVRPMAYRHQVLGADFQTTVGSFGLRGEAALRIPFADDEHPEAVPMDDVQLVLGVDRALGWDLTLLVQYHGRYVPDWEELDSLMIPEDGGEPSEAEMMAAAGQLGSPQAIEEDIRRGFVLKNRMIASQRVQLGHTLFGRLSWKALQETFEAEVACAYSVSTEELMLRPMVGYAIADGLKVRGGAEIYRGPAGSLYDLIEERQSAAFAELRASF